MIARHELFRESNDEDEVSVTYIELFFDLVFVFAITQLSHHLLDHFSLHGAIETLILLAALWWVWIYTSWVTNWLDPERAGVRLMLLAMMMGGLALGVTLPKAFAEYGIVFAATYIVMQIGRTGFMIWASRGHNDARARNFTRITAYFLISAPLWIAGGLLTGDARLWLWAAALAIEYAGPFVQFRTPGLGASKIADWDISGAHMAERCALFIIICLGEGVLVTGATYADRAPDPEMVMAFITCFIGTAAMWWVYFDIGAKRGAKMIEEAHDTGRIARNAYTYLHMIIVAGLVVTAVADAKMLKAPAEAGSIGYILVACGGPWLFLMGNFLFKWSSAGSRFGPLSHGIGMTLLLIIGVSGWGFGWNALVIGIAATLALIATAIWEWLSLHGGWERWAPWMGRVFRSLPTS